MRTLILKSKETGEEVRFGVPAEDAATALLMWQTFETFREMRTMFTVIPWRIA